MRRARLAAVALAAVLLTAVAPRPAGAALASKASSWPAGAVPGSLLVTQDDGAVRLVRVEPGREAAAAAELAREPGVAAVEPDYLRRALKVPNDPAYSAQWAHNLTRAPAAWDVTTGDPSVTVAIIDSGVDGTHPDLKANIVGQAVVAAGTATDVALGTNNDPCGFGHGTLVAGVIGGIGNNSIAVAGVAWKVGILDIAAASRTHCVGSFSDSDIVASMKYAIDHRANVINLSLGGQGDTCPAALQGLINQARAAGIVVVAAAGNEQVDFPGSTEVPGSCNGVIGVGAVGPTGAHSYYSNANDYVDVVAPGGDDRVADPSGAGGKIVSTGIGGTVKSSEGTSFSSPYVAGVVALLRSVRSGLTPDEAEAILEGTTQTPLAGHSSTLGWGLIDTAAAVQAAKSGTIPAAKPHADFPVAQVVRISAQTLITDPMRQAVAVSRKTFPTDGKALQVVLARPDDYADALAGSSLGFGVGPLLFTPSTGGVDSFTASEIQRVLPAGGRVYLLGGTAALSSDLESQLRNMGYNPVRLAGTTRMGTAAAVAREVVRRIVELGFPAPTRVMLATAFQWPDAVTAGEFGATWGYPILLTDANRLSDDTRAVLGDLRPQQLYIVGGTAAVSPQVAADAESASGAASVQRLAGVDRDETAVAVARQYDRDFLNDVGIPPIIAVGVNLRRDGAFANVLSASTLVGALPGVFIPIEGDNGDRVPPAAASYVCGISPTFGFVVGEGDMVTDQAKAQLNGLFTRAGC